MQIEAFLQLAESTVKIAHSNASAFPPSVTPRRIFVKKRTGGSFF